MRWRCCAAVLPAIACAQGREPGENAYAPPDPFLFLLAVAVFELALAPSQTQAIRKIPLPACHLIRKTPCQINRKTTGAIDLVLHARGCSFRQALAFLDALPPAPAHAPPAQPGTVRALSLPPPCDSRWPPVRHYLARSRRLRPRLLDHCRQAGILWADARQNAVFLCRDLRRRHTGAELNGSRPSPSGATFKGLAPGSRKQRGGFWIARRTPPSDAPPPCVLLCESAINALSALLLNLPQLPPHTLFASLAGLANSIPQWLSSTPPQRLLCGFDNDPPGQLAAQRLLARHPSARRLPPPGAKDWNQLLVRSC